MSVMNSFPVRATMRCAREDLAEASRAHVAGEPDAMRRWLKSCLIDVTDLRRVLTEGLRRLGDEYALAIAMDIEAVTPTKVKPLGALALYIERFSHALDNFEHAIELLYEGERMAAWRNAS